MSRIDPYEGCESEKCACAPAILIAGIGWVCIFLLYWALGGGR